MKNVASVNYSDCIACEMCVSNCPVEAIIMKDGHAKVKYNDCIFCQLCIDNCPVNAIEEKEIEL